MVYLLLERGVSFNGMWKWGGIRPSLIEMTDHLGYDSMTEILRREHVFEFIPLSPSLFKGHAFCWHKWPEAKSAAAPCKCSYDDGNW
jgi:hypothetical protein